MPQPKNKKLILTALSGAALLAVAWVSRPLLWRVVYRGHVAHYERQKEAYVRRAAREREKALKGLAVRLRATFHAEPVTLNPREVGGRGNMQVEQTRYNPGVSETPPATRSRVTLSPNTAADQAVRINDAIEKAVPPVEIVLTEGLYETMTPINLKKPGVVLKGEGIRKTVILFSGPGNAVNISGEQGREETEIVAGYACGSSVLGVERTSGLHEGRLARIHFDHAPESRFDHPNDRFGQIVRIDRITSATELVIDTPLRVVTESPVRPRLTEIEPIRFSGLEALTIETRPYREPLFESGPQSRGPGRATGHGGSHTVNISYALDCWVRDCELSRSRFSHIWVKRSKRLTFSGNYVHHGWGYRVGGDYAGYGLCLEGGTADCLVADNVFSALRHAMIVEAGACGNVFAYNYSTENNPQRNKDDSSDLSAHGGYPYMNLVEGNVLQFAHSSDYFGPAGPLQTFFRNRIEGKGIIISFDSHFPVIAANVFSRGGIYIEDGTAGATITANRMANAVLPDKLFYEGSTCYLFNELPWQDDRLRPSLYLRKKPDFLGDAPWPCFGPDVESESVVLPAERRFKEVYSRWDAMAVPLQPSLP